MAKPRFRVIPGDVVVIPQLDGAWTVAQVLDFMFPDVLSCAIYNTRLKHKTDPVPPLRRDDVFSAVSTTLDLVKSKRWSVVGHEPVQLEQSRWPNEQFRSRRWVGSKTFGSGTVEDFLNAFYGLAPWDEYKDPDYFDKLLISEAWRPANVVRKTH